MSVVQAEQRDENGQMSEKVVQPKRGREPESDEMKATNAAKATAKAAGRATGKGRGRKNGNAIREMPLETKVVQPKREREPESDEMKATKAAKATAKAAGRATGEGRGRKDGDAIREMPLETKVKFAPDAKPKHTLSGKRYHQYCGATTLAEALSLGATRNDLQYDHSRGHFKAVTPKGRKTEAGRQGGRRAGRKQGGRHRKPDKRATGTRRHTQAEPDAQSIKDTVGKTRAEIIEGTAKVKASAAADRAASARSELPPAKLVKKSSRKEAKAKAASAAAPVDAATEQQPQENDDVGGDGDVTVAAAAEGEEIATSAKVIVMGKATESRRRWRVLKTVSRDFGNAD